MKRTISLFLSAVMVLSCFFGLSFDAFASTFKNMGTINAGEIKTIEIDDEDDIAYYTFTPSVTGVYKYYSLAEDRSVDPVGYIYEGDQRIERNDDDDEDESEVGYYNFFIYRKLIAGTTYKLAGNCYDNEYGSYDVTVELDETNNIQGIKFEFAKPPVLYENLDGDWEEGSDDNEYFYYELPSLYNNGNTLTLYYNDGSEDTFAYDEDFNDFYSDTSQSILSGYLWARSNQREEHWSLGTNNEMEIYYRGHICTVKVEVAETPAASVQFINANPYEVIEHLGGDWEEDYDGDDFYYYYYENYSPYKNGNKIIVNFKDGSTKEYVYNRDLDSLITSDDEVLKNNYVDWYSYQYDSPWEKGKTNHFILSVYGIEVEVPITVVDNPVASVQYVPVKANVITEYTNGEWETRTNDTTGKEENYYCYDTSTVSPANDGNKIIVKFKNGTTKEFIYNSNRDYFVTKTGEVLNWGYIDWYYSQYSKPWVRGTNYFILKVYGKEIKVPVTIVAKATPAPAVPATPTLGKIKAGKKRFTLAWTKVNGATGYEIQYSRNKKFKKGKKYGTKTKKVSAAKAKVTIKKLKKGKRYYVRIRAVKGTQVSPWSKTKKIKVK